MFDPLLEVIQRRHGLETPKEPAAGGDKKPLTECDALIAAYKRIGVSVPLAESAREHRSNENPTALEHWQYKRAGIGDG